MPFNLNQLLNSNDPQSKHFQQEILNEFNMEPPNFHTEEFLTKYLKSVVISEFNLLIN